MFLSLSIKQKIWIAFTSLAMIYVFSGIFTIYSLQYNQLRLREISEEIDPAINMLEDLNFIVSRSRNVATRYFYGQGGDHDRDELIRLTRKDFLKVKADVGLLAQKWPNDTSLKHIQVLIPVISKALNKQVEVVDMVLKKEDGTKVNKLMAEVLPVNTLIIDKLQDLEIQKRGEKKVLEKDLIESSEDLVMMIIVLSIMITIGGVYLAFIMSNRIIKPINYISNIIGMLSKGLLPQIHEVTFEKEIGGIMGNLILLKDGLKHTVEFANNIGSGNLNAEFIPLSDRDQLGHSLIHMRESLKDAAGKDDEYNETVSLVAEVSAILRNYHELDRMADVLLPFLCNRLEMVQGAFYITLPDDSHTIHLTSIYAYDRKKFVKRDFKTGEGLIGQAFNENDLIYLTELPEDYITIKSGLLGAKKPAALVLLPLISNNTVYGVLEFASLSKVSDKILKQIRDLSEIIGQTLFNTRVNEQTRQLLLESQKMSVELKRRQEELHKNAEEMKETQRQLKRSNILLEDQVDEVKRSNKKIQVLLENTPGIITICDEKGQIKYVSPSVINVLGYMPEEILNTNETLRIPEEYRDVYNDMLTTVLENPFYSKTVQYNYRKKNGQVISIEATAKNMLNEEAIKGLVINSNDITQRKRAEKESRLRGQMQSLSENSPDLICRFSKDRKIYYINPVIEKLLDRSPAEFINKSIFETYLNEKVVAEWEELIRIVIESLQTAHKEMIFPAINRDLIMSVNVIPEFNEENSLESILLVSNDVTERKRQELELQHKNQKITDSINYAKRIQKSILPESYALQEYVPESFILYKPKDVISGDFPWIAVEGDDIFIAAVDCTGHGVPGALISLVGYFLLNDIVRGQHVFEPAEILTKLDEGVMHTLRQDIAGSEIRDGMDMSLIRINRKKNFVQYAGAHRPLYQISDGELITYKGNKLPIGGGNYNNIEKVFSQYTLDVRPGDVILVGTDGYADQFGGPDNRKFTPARMRNILQENYNDSMDKLSKRFEKDIDAWRGDMEQTDDILLIGMRF